MTRVTLARRDVRRVCMRAQWLTGVRPALPVLYGDSCVAKLEAAADRYERMLRVKAVHWDVGPTRAMATATEREIDHPRGLARDGARLRSMWGGSPQTPVSSAALAPRGESAR